MQTERKGTGDAIRLRLSLNQKTTEELQQVLLRRDPANTRKYLFDAKTRNAASVVLRVRLGGQNRTQTPAPISNARIITPTERERAERAAKAMHAALWPGDEWNHLDEDVKDRKVKVALIGLSAAEG